MVVAIVQVLYLNVHIYLHSTTRVACVQGGEQDPCTKGDMCGIVDMFDMNI